MKKLLETYTLEAANNLVNIVENCIGLHGKYSDKPSIFFELSYVYIEKIEDYLLSFPDQTSRFDNKYGDEDYIVLVNLTLIEPKFKECGCSDTQIIFEDFLKIVDEPLDKKLCKYLRQYEESCENLDFPKKLLSLRMPYGLNCSCEMRYYKGELFPEVIPYTDQSREGYMTIIGGWDQTLDNGVFLTSYFSQDSITKEVECYQFPELSEIINVDFMFKTEYHSFKVFLRSKLVMDVTAYYEANFEILNK